MTGPHYTPEVKRLAEGIRGLTAGELLALREALEGFFTPPPDIGVREPSPAPPGVLGGAVALEDDS